jgi:hypothetical protein
MPHMHAYRRELKELERLLDEDPDARSATMGGVKGILPSFLYCLDFYGRLHCSAKSVRSNTCLVGVTNMHGHNILVKKRDHAQAPLHDRGAADN